MKNRTSSFILTLAIVAVIGYFVISLISLQMEKREKIAEVNQAQAKFSTVQQENKELEKELSEGDHSAYIERIARDVLGYVLPGERVYYDISSGDWSWGGLLNSMALEIGAILEGKVTGLTKFGAFVDLGDGKTGMVHISEVASTYVNEINDFVEVGQDVKVKVLTIDEKGKISLSMKQAEEPSKDDGDDEKHQRPHHEHKKRERSAPNVWQGQKPKETSDNMSFEEMMSKWKTSSDEKMADLKRSTDTKHSGYGKRSGARR